MADEFRVLIVDDEDEFRETLVARLKKRNLKVWGAESGRRALDLMETIAFDVVVLDIKMPGMDGIEALEQMKKKTQLTEVILLTGHASIEAGIEGMKLGAFDYLMKPVNIDELLAKIRQAYQRKVVQEQP
jgi:DNA-binding response OmpR family regulator